MAIETHPFEIFAPANIKFLLIGSFTSKDASTNPDYDWYYSNGRNQFWPLIEQVYSIKLPDRKSKMDLFDRLGIGIADIIYKADRTKDSSLDNVLKVVEYNSGISSLLARKLNAVFFSSRFVQSHFLKAFADIPGRYPGTKFIYLPSPSPRYAAMSKQEKIGKYKQLLPKYHSA